MDLRLLVLRNMKHIIGIVPQHFLIQKRQHLRRVIGVAESAVKRDILLDLKIINGILQ